MVFGPDRGLACAGWPNGLPVDGHNTAVHSGGANDTINLVLADGYLGMSWIAAISNEPVQGMVGDRGWPICKRPSFRTILN